VPYLTSWTVFFVPGKDKKQHFSLNESLRVEFGCETEEILLLLTNLCLQGILAIDTHTNKQASLNKVEL
jgi:hypothetical protein